MAILTDHSINKFLDKKLVIYPFDRETCLTPLGYDLRIGYAVALNKRVINYQNNEKIIIPPKSSMFIITKEHIWLSGEIIGTLHSIGGLSAQGLIINSTTVDPNWAGQLTCLVTNLTEHPIKLDINSKFLTMILHEASVCTTSIPEGGPITVAEKYGSIYGEDFSQSLLKYLTSESNKKTEQIFKQKIEKAQLQNNWFKHVKEKIFNFMYSLPNIIRYILIALLVLIAIGSALLIPYWNDFATLIGIQLISLDGNLFIAIIAIIVPLLLAIIGLLEFKSKKVF